jgi:quercetin 2,3-dioxygenase
MINVRPADSRGHADHGWLVSRHTFSFADYHDPDAMGFRSLRVINEDRVAPGAGFPTHAHRDMEILSYVLEGALEHEDSMGPAAFGGSAPPSPTVSGETAPAKTGETGGTGSIIRPGDLQRMSAGTGVRHSEYNASKTEPVHFLQIWILPEQQGAPPGYEQRTFSLDERRGCLRLIASRDAAGGSVRIAQDVRLYSGSFDGDERASLPLAAGRHAWVQVARGEIHLGDRRLVAGDGAALIGEPAVDLSRGAGAEVLVFDLA